MQMKQITQNIEKSISEKLLRWYDGNARVLPWRSNPTPYFVWVSEIMLQQTRVETAMPYFFNFTHALPDIASLAQIDEQQLYKLWEGLGYYSRVRNMQKAAREIVEKYNGVVPDDPRLLATLPGIGEYTAGAIASIAFSKAVPAVDGNVLRVFSRLLASRDDIDLPQTKKAIKAIVERALPGDRPGDFNQALMDLGATVCLPNTEPECGKCPLNEICEGYRAGIARELPVKKQAKPRIVEELTVFVIVHNHRVLIKKRKLSGLLAGLWEFPNSEGALTVQEAKSHLSGIFSEPFNISPLGEAKHIFTHREWHMKGYLIKVNDTAPPENCVWADDHQLHDSYSIPSAFKFYLRAAENAINV